MALKSNEIAFALRMQALPNVYDAPNLTTDVMPISNLQFAIAGVTVQNAEYTGSIHKNGDDLAGKTCSGSFNVYLRPPGGSDVPAADAFLLGRILKAAKFAEVRNTAAIPAAPAALGAGSDETHAVLGAAAASVDDTYKGMAIALSDIATTPYDRVTAVRHYTGATKSAELMEVLSDAPAANYQILKQLSFQRDMTQADAPSLSTKLWLGGRRYDLVDFQISGLRINTPVSTRDAASQPVLEVSFTATIHDFEDEAAPAVPALGPVPLFKDGKFWIAGKAVGGSSVVVDLGLRVAYPPNPNFTEGSEAGVLVESRTTINIDLQAYRKAQFNTLALAEGQQQYPVYAQWGYTGGRMVQIVAPDARFNYQSPNVGQDFINETGDMWVDAFSRNVCINFPYLA